MHKAEFSAVYRCFDQWAQFLSPTISHFVHFGPSFVQRFCPCGIEEMHNNITPLQKSQADFQHCDDAQASDLYPMLYPVLCQTWQTWLTSHPVRRGRKPAGLL